MNSAIREITEGKKILILGFGKEGLSTYRAIRASDLSFHVAIADENAKLEISISIREDVHITWHLGPSCYNELSQYDLIIKSPGVPMRKLNGVSLSKITSQTDIFLNLYFRQAIGVTGTKGKSTTATLINHILKESGRTTVFVGNIGVPPLDYLGKISKDTIVVMELSAHQGEIIHHAPHTMVLLNIFQEHLDHFGSFERYTKAKLNFHNKQIAGDNFIFHDEDNITCQELIQKPGIAYFPVSIKHPTAGTWFEKDKFHSFIGKEYTILDKHQPLKGMHNKINICAALTAGYLCGLSPEGQASALRNFTPLEHRLEFVDTVAGIDFYNDSISTIPEATIAAIEALKDVATIIIGGYDRGIDYSGLATFLISSLVKNIILMGKAGDRVYKYLAGHTNSLQQLICVETLEIGVSKAFQLTPKGSVCLLSPAASSYDSYKNFEERGKHYKKLIRDKK